VDLVGIATTDLAGKDALPRFVPDIVESSVLAIL